MKTQTKSLLIIITTLVIGFFIGVMGHRAWMGYHFKKTSKIVYRGGMREILKKRINPAPEQYENVNIILDKYDSLFTALHMQSRRETRAILDSMWIELESILGREQMKRILRHGPPDRGLMKRGPFNGKRKDKRAPSPEHMIQRLERIIEPTEQQKDTVRALLNKYLPNTEDTLMLTPPEMHKRIDSMKRELRNVLTSEQIKRLEISDGPPMGFHLGPPPNDRP